ncbi:GlxA family transcriptional regulator [Undibacterium umbellatum]|uniref:Helix-turn-helix domain-containing protein n=1 Tax=Undibacterium umbellatum TaxID=2762300 RepID=A0ABR6ZAY4_9BURK|nr:helix-turn-helix domain-containing protein [Undibacterium umbellatum]MBC3908843.1 helix-turn-helix domain-containing protein [Undibacterium umbellatum]
MAHIEVWLYPQCMASAVTGPLDVFAVANAIWSLKNVDEVDPLFTWSLHSIDGEAVMTPAKVRLSADASIQAESKADVILLPGLYMENGITGLTSSMHAMRALFPILRARHAQGCVLAANCSATFLLAEAGLLDGGHATTTWWLERAFKTRYPEVSLRLSEVLDEYENILTSGAATSFLNLAYHLVERFGGQDIASGVAKTLLIDANRTSQMPYMQMLSLTQQDTHQHENILVQRAQKWLSQNHHLPFRLPALAEHLAVSERTVIRHFHQTLDTTPASYAQQVKMDIAKRLLETTTLTLEQVAERTGYSDPSSFRRLFKKHSGLSPASYREQFRPAKRVVHTA